MSSLIFETSKKRAFVATDTLAVALGGKPVRFTNKAIFLPHIRTIIAVTGFAGILTRWSLFINDHLSSRGIEHLNGLAPAALSSIWKAFIEDFPCLAGSMITTTVYHFGFSETEDFIRSFAYRSTSDFQSDPLPYGIALKPECDVPLTGDLKKVMESQRAIQGALPEDERLHIGGEIIVYDLREGGCLISTLDRFDDYDEMEIAMRK